MEDTLSNQPLNLTDLENIQSKLLQIKESILFFLQTCDPSVSPAFASWDDVLSKFNLLVAKFVSYNNEINRSSLYQKVLLHPNFISQNEQEAHVLSHLFRTKQIPEIEKEEEELFKEKIPGVPDDEEDTINEADHRELENILALWQSRALRHDAICSHASDAFQQMRQRHDFKKRPKISHNFKEDTQEDTTSPSQSPKRSELKQPSKSLDQILGWYSSGRRFDS